MPVETNDIQLSNDAKGIGKALRIVEGENIDLAFSNDADFPNIKILTITSSGGSSGGLTQQQIEGLI